MLNEYQGPVEKEKWATSGGHWEGDKWIQLDLGDICSAMAGVTGAMETTNYSLGDLIKSMKELGLLAKDGTPKPVTPAPIGHLKIMAGGAKGYVIVGKDGKEIPIKSWTMTPPKSHTQTTDFGSEAFKEMVSGVAKCTIKLDPTYPYDPAWLDAMYQQEHLSQEDYFAAKEKAAFIEGSYGGKKMTMDFETLRAAYKSGAISQLQFVEAVNMLEDDAALEKYANMKTSQVEAEKFLKGLGLNISEAAKKEQLEEAKKKASGYLFPSSWEGATPPQKPINTAADHNKKMAGPEGLVAYKKYMEMDNTSNVPLGPSKAQNVGLTTHATAFTFQPGAAVWLGPNGEAVNYGSGKPFGFVQSTLPNGSVTVSYFPPPSQKKSTPPPAKPPEPVIPEIAEVKRPGRKVFKGGQ